MPFSLVSTLARAALAGSLGSIGAVMGTALLLGHSDLGRAPPPHFGNFRQNLERVSHRAGVNGFRLAVIGDGQASTTSRRLLASLVDLDPDAVVLVGDAVRSADEGRHRLLAAQVGRSLPGTPVLYLPGNRDIGYSAREVGHKQFRERYGSDRFVVEAAGNLLIGLGIACPYGDGPSELAFLEAELARPREGIARTLVFSHFAPIVTTTQGDMGLDPDSSRRFLDLCRKYRVDYVVSGHFHGYARAEVEGTRILITGGGGSRFHHTRQGRTHHALVLDFQPDRIEEILVTQPKALDLDNLTVGLLMGEVYPRLGQDPLQDRY